MTIVAERLRQSFAALYDSCPRAALFSISEGEHSTHAQGRGTIAHEFKRRVIAECIENQETTYPVEMAKPLMVEVIAESGLTVPAEEFDWLMGLAWKFCETHTFNIDKIVDLEEEYTTEIDGLILTGRPDLLEIDGRTARIKDYKTGWAIDPETELRGSFQGRWYAKIVFDNYPQLHTVELVWEYERWTQTREVIITRSDLPDIDAMLSMLVARIRRSRHQDEWPASPGKWCSLCPSPQKCPIPSDYRGEGLVSSPESAEAVGDLLLSLEAIRTRAKASLRAWCDEHGPLEIGGMRFDFKPTADSERVIDKDALRDQMKRAGLAWDDHFKTVKGSTQFKARKVA